VGRMDKRKSPTNRYLMDKVLVLFIDMIILIFLEGYGC